MEEIIRDLKRHTAKVILKAISENPQESRREWMLWHFSRAGKRNSNNENYQFWQQNNQPIELNTNFMIDQKLAYIHQNPVENGFSLEPETYPYSSAQDYAGRKGSVNITFLE
ncbi:MAG: transposase [Adhaeribacter sp.]